MENITNAFKCKISKYTGYMWLTLSDNSTFNEKIIAAFDSNISF